jgi:hypothetical protein
MKLDLNGRMILALSRIFEAPVSFDEVSSGFTDKESQKIGLRRLYDRILNTSINSEFDNFAGNPNKCEIILVGEKPSRSSPFRKTLPFLDFTASSGWLNRHLDQNGINENSLLWVNAYNLDDSPNDSNIIKNLESPVICLGSKAHHWCALHGIKAFKTYHPQYWKRFRLKEPYPLIEMIKQNL